MAYTAVKLADVQKAIAAVTAAQKKYTDAQSSTKTSQTAVDNAKKALQTAQDKLGSLQSDFDNQKYLASNSGYQSALKASQAAQQKLQASQDFIDSGKYLQSNTTYQNNLKALQTAQQKLDAARTYIDSGDFLNKNSGYQTALKNITAKEQARDKAQSALDNATDKNRASLQKAFNAANSAVDAAYTARDKAEQAARTAAEAAVNTAQKTYDTTQTNVDKSRDAAQVAAEKARDLSQKTYDTSQSSIETARAAAERAAAAPIAAQQKLVDTSQSTFDKAQEKYQSVLDSIQPYLDQRNDAIGNVSSYINDIRGSLGDVTTGADAKAVQTLLSQIQTTVNGTKISELINPVNSMISQIDPMKMSNIPTLNAGFKNLSPDVFSNIDRNTGLPILNQGALDNVLNKYKSNTLTSGQYRDNWDKFGWNSKSDGSTVSHGAAIVGLDSGTIGAGMGPGEKGIVKAGTNTAATDADFKKAADQLGIDINNYYTTKETTGTYGQKSTTKVLDKQSLYNDINSQLKDFYVVGNALETPGANKAAEHAAVLFKADGSGGLTPVTKEDGSLAASYYKTPTVSHAGWKGQLADLAPVISIASMAFLPGISSAFSEAIGGSTLGGALGTTAAGEAVTLGSILGTTGTNMLANSALSAGMAAITGGDVTKAALSGAASAAAVTNASDIATTVLGGGETGAANLAAIAKAGNLTQDQAAKIIASGVSSGLTAGIQGADVLKSMESSILSNFAGTEAKNTVGRILSDIDSVTSNQIAKAADIAGNITKVGTQALITGTDLGTALQAAAPSIFAGVIKGAPVVERGIYDTGTTAGLDIGQVGAVDSIKTDILGAPIYQERANELKTVLPQGTRLATANEAENQNLRAVTLDNGQMAFVVPTEFSISDQAGMGGLSIFGAPTIGAGGAGGLGSIYGGDMADIYGTPTGALPEQVSTATPDLEGIADLLPEPDMGSLPEQSVTASPEAIQENLVSLGLDPVSAQTVAKTAAGKPTSYLNQWYAILSGQQQKRPSPLGIQETNILMTPEQMQARGIPYTPPPEQPQFYKRGGLASTR